MPASSVEIANEFLRIEGAAQKISQMKLHKLVFISDGWSLALLNCQLVEEDAKAWTYGPVFPFLYDHTKKFGDKPIGRLLNTNDKEIIFFRSFLRAHEYQAKIKNDERDLIQAVWENYGHVKAMTLSNMTHMIDTPWDKTRKAKGLYSTIDKEIVAQHYRDLSNRADKEQA